MEISLNYDRSPQLSLTVVFLSGILMRLAELFPVGFEPTISAGERQQTYSLNRSAIIFYVI